MQQSKRNWEQEAQDMISYFKPLSEQMPAGIRIGEWQLGLFMAHQWLRLVRHSSPDKAEIALFCKAMESQKMNMGCGWHDMIMRAKWWARTECEIDV